MKEAQRSSLTAISEGVILFAVMLIGCNAVSPGYGTFLLVKYLPWFGGGMVGAGALALALKWRPGKEQPQTTMERIFKRCNICVKEGDSTYYPVLVERNKNFLLYSPPVGMSIKSWIDRMDVFQQAFGEVEFEQRGALIGVTIHTEHLKEKVGGEAWIEQSRDGD